MCASVNVPRSDEPRCPLVPKLTRCVGIVRVGPALVVLALEPGQVDQHLLRGRLACEGRDRHRAARSLRTGHGFAFQISLAYSAIVRSLENLPEPATFRIALRAQASGSAYSATEPLVAPRDRTSGRPGACSGRRASAACRAAARRPGLVAAEVVGEDQVERRARLRLVLVVPVRVVPAAAVGDLLAPSGRTGRSSPRRPPRPSRSSRRRACRWSARRSS